LKNLYCMNWLPKQWSKYTHAHTQKNVSRVRLSKILVRYSPIWFLTGFGTPLSVRITATAARAGGSGAASKANAADVTVGVNLLCHAKEYTRRHWRIRLLSVTFDLPPLSAPLSAPRKYAIANWGVFGISRQHQDVRLAAMQQEEKTEYERKPPGGSARWAPVASQNLKGVIYHILCSALRWCAERRDRTTRRKVSDHAYQNYATCVLCFASIPLCWALKYKEFFHLRYIPLGISYS